MNFFENIGSLFLRQVAILGSLHLISGHSVLPRFFHSLFSCYLLIINPGPTDLGQGTTTQTTDNMKPAIPNELPSDEPLISPASFLEKDVLPACTTQSDEEASREQRSHLPPDKPSKYKLSQVSSWACIIVIGQLVIMAISLTFFILIHFSHTPMTQGVAEWGKASPRALSFCVTIVATMLSSLTTLFFSKGLILYLTSHSNRPVPLINFLTVSGLSRGAPIVSRHHFSWTLLSLLVLVLVNSLTASFITIISPTSLIIDVPLRGTEFNLFNAQFADMITNSSRGNSLPLLNSTQKRINNQVAAIMNSLSVSSAYTSASRQIGYPGVISYLGISFNSTTGGIVPAVPKNGEFMGANSGVAFNLDFRNLQPTFEFLDSNFKPSKKFPSNFTAIQQGYSADVECRELPATGTPQDAGLTVQQESNLTIPDQTRNTSLWRYFVQCPSQELCFPLGSPLPVKNHSTLLASRGSMIVSDTCYDTTFDGQHVPGTQLLILGGYGPMYQIIKPRACQFTPYTTLSEVKYSNMVNITRIISKEPTTPATAAISAMMYLSVISALTSYAVDTRNKFGDDIASLYAISSDLDTYDGPLLNGILEAYFRGSIETRATVTHQNATDSRRSSRDTFPCRSTMLTLWNHAGTLEELPQDWKRTFDGVWSYETLGWHEDKGRVQSSIIGIIPILLITTTTIFMVLFSWLSLRGTRHLRHEPFDPNNLVTLLKAGRDGAVVDILGNHTALSSKASQSNVRIKLHRNATQWELRPVNSS
ncbi:hypothetical protein VP01_2108g1 [Puccinia sorghi]|uniref:Uncharacterized protein n=1 Tax=Puccinia sorghi TaxID=27349 RepID=A0A0L6VAA7_9BASI|nr:hypothetical protein VP01_2108g1 [Puccinia sorghi]